MCFVFGSPDRKTNVKESKVPAVTTVKTSCCVVGEKEAFCGLKFRCFPSKDLTLFGLVGTDCVSRSRWFGRFLAGSCVL